MDPAQWRKEVGDFRKYLAQFGARLPRGADAEPGCGGKAGLKADGCGAERASIFLADETNRLRGVLFGQLAQADHSLALDLHAVPAHEGFITVLGLHESAIGALVDEYELVPVDLDARMEPGDQIALDDEIVVFGPPDRHPSGDARRGRFPDPGSAAADAGAAGCELLMPMAGTMLVTSSLCQSTS